jgi:hypothetical protein
MGRDSNVALEKGPGAKTYVLLLHFLLMQSQSASPRSIEVSQYHKRPAEIIESSAFSEQ